MLGRCLEGKTCSTGKRCMWTPRFSRQIDNFETVSAGSVTGYGGWCSGQRWHRLWSRLWSLVSALVGWRCTCSYASPGYLRIFRGAIWARKASGPVVLMKHIRVSFYRSLNLFMPRTFNTLLLLFPDLAARLLDSVLSFLHCGLQKPSIRHFGRAQSQAHAGLFQLYPTSSPGHRSRHVEYVQDIRCYFK